jgi:lipopolysaccharide transport system ATP-binding protein
LLQNEYGEFKRILDHLGIEIPPKRLRKIVKKCSFESLSGGRIPGDENRHHHYRKGVAGDWKNHMPEGGRVYEEFVKRWGALVEELGYQL